MSDSSTAKPPGEADVVVIGGGIAGVCTAYELAKDGVSVVLCEKGAIGAEQSSRNWGYVRQQGRDPAEIPLIIEALRRWRGLSDEIGEDVSFRQTGVIYIGDTDAEVQRFSDWLPYARDYQIDSRMLTGDEIDALLPGGKTRWRVGLTTPSDGRAEPSIAPKKIAAAAERAGATILTKCAVRGLERSGGRVSGVVTERGTIKTASAVLAGGAWSTLFCASLGIRFPQLTVHSSVMRTAAGPDFSDGAVWTPKFAVRRRLDGGYTVAHGGHLKAELTADHFRYFRDFIPMLRAEGPKIVPRFGRRLFETLATPRRWSLDEETPFERIRVLDPEPYGPPLEVAQRELIATWPQFADMKIVERWAGYIDTMPDAVPVIGPVARIPGFYLATGFSGHGFGIGPGAGKLAADIVTGANTIVDPAPFRLERFAG